MLSNIIRLSEKIKGLTSEGIHLERPTLSYIESTFGAAAPEFLDQLLHRSDDPEADTLFELILFPDEAFQARLEPTLTIETFSPGDIDAVVKKLVQNKWDPPIIFPDGLGYCRIIIPHAVVRQFVSRLNITRRIPSPIEKLIVERFADSGMIQRCRVRLRNGRFPFRPALVDFLCRLFERLPGSDTDFLSLLTMTVNFLDHINDEADIYGALMDRKRHCLRMIHEAEKSEKDMRQLPMEVLMLRGTTVTSVDTETLLRQMAAVDRIGLAVYGKTDHVEPVAKGTYSFNPSASHTGNIEAIIKILS